MKTFKDTYNQLNERQKAAVDTIEGPLLVLAGPGTGKTQLLSARVANILSKTDALPSNILCLTFTESAAQNMRERLNTLIGQDAYDVHINTYHGFGSDIIKMHPEYFEKVDLETGKDTRLEKPIDELQQIQTMGEVIEALPYTSALYGAKYYVKSVVQTISELKRSLYSPASLTELGTQNLKQHQELSVKIADALQPLTELKRMPSKGDKAISLFIPVLEILRGNDGLAHLAAGELDDALAEADETGKGKTITAWKNKWLEKDEEDRYLFTNKEQHLRIIELAKVFKNYQATLEEKGLYDFDDMILKAVDGLKTHDDLRFTLQEKYQYILLDEFQDTNKAQFELVEQLGDNPVNEGRPNIMAVGDDDQAIYAFQGAEVSNMLAFKEMYRETKVVNLTQNYRSHKDVVHVAHGVAEQIESRLHYNLDGIEKTLEASSNDLPVDATIARHEFAAEASEYAWVSDKINQLIGSGVQPKEIAILAPKHSFLEGIVPFFAKNKTPLSYEKRENILNTKMIRSLELMSRLVIACRSQNIAQMNELFPKVLSLDFYQIPVNVIWQLNWQTKRSENWTEVALEDEQFTRHIHSYIKLGLLSTTEPLEYILDYLMGTSPILLDLEDEYTVPFKDFYFKDHTDNTLDYFESLANLSIIRDKIRSMQNSQDDLLTIESFIELIEAYKSAEQPLLNTHPISLNENSVQLMTAYKAKGLEFEYVFILSAHDDVWGSKARSNSNKLSLPENLKPIRYAGSDEDELRRILFVAITRAKHGLFISSHATKDNGKATEPIKYLSESTDGDTRFSEVLPDNANQVEKISFEPHEVMEHVQTLWEARHLNLDATLKGLLKERLERYQMSPTHLNTITDDLYGGWDAFLLGTLLRFPQAPSADGEFGNVIHRVLEWHQNQLNMEKETSEAQLKKQLDTLMDSSYISANDKKDYQDRAHRIFNSYIKDRALKWASGDAKTEVDFRNEGVLLENAHLTGKIDRLEVDEKNKTVQIADYKTGEPSTKWASSNKLNKYKQQLYFYKFLIEGSSTYKGYAVESARLEFVEPDKTSGQIVPPLKIEFKEKDEAKIKETIIEMFEKIINLDFSDE